VIHYQKGKKSVKKSSSEPPNPEDREIPDPEFDSSSRNIDEQVKDFVHHFSDGGRPRVTGWHRPSSLPTTNPTSLGRIEGEFERLGGTRRGPPRRGRPDPRSRTNRRGLPEPSKRSSRVTCSPTTSPRMRTRRSSAVLTTERLITDQRPRASPVFIDYHSLDSGLFDRLVRTVPRTTEGRTPGTAQCREPPPGRRLAVRRRRKPAAEEEYERCASGQSEHVFEDVFEERLSELTTVVAA